MNTILALDSPEATLVTAGGKGANLSKLLRAGLPVPPGFLLPVSAYAAFVAANGLDQVIAAALNALNVVDPVALESASTHIRAAFAAGALAPAQRAALAAAYRQLGEPPVAVRSSATAEDLPDLSFAGQQDTFLNVRGLESLYTTVVRCWSSLWTGRAIGYRAANGIDQTSVALAVVVQVMAPAQASGVLFTANPLTGRRTETVIDATLGLGEALVSGLVEPDHYVVDVAHNGILRKTIGAKATVIRSQADGGTVTQQGEHRDQAIADPLILQLAALGSRVQSLYGSPQDIEWASDGERLYLLQARPITSLYPTPDGMPPDPLQVMFAFAAVQGMLEPLTPLGQDLIKLVFGGLRRLFGLSRDFGRQQVIVSAGERLYINVTSVLRNRIGREVLPRELHIAEPSVAQVLSQLIHDPRLAFSGPPLRLPALRGLLGFVLPLLRRVLRIWVDPDGARRQIVQTLDALPVQMAAQWTGTGDVWADYTRRLDLLLTAADILPAVVVPQGLAAVLAGLVPFFAILQPLARRPAANREPETAQLPLTIARGLPHNVTTEMNLALWQAAQVIRSDPETAQAFLAAPAAQLAKDYLAGGLPPVAQMAIAIFLHQYGMRGPGEIDIGRPRWRERPEPLMQTLQSYLALTDPQAAPNVVFGRGAVQAAEAAQQLEAAVARTRGGPLKAALVRWAVTRYRALGGLRETPKFFIVRVMGIVRQGLLESGATLAANGQLDQPDDLFYLYVTELQEIGARRTVSPALRAAITERRALHERELRRKQLPRVLLSDGTAYYGGAHIDANPDNADNAGILAGDGVSPGVVEGVVHVVFSPHAAQLAPGEILVCPGTDPAWTPLFLAAGGLVTEVGGMMTHGSVVAREYGIPAVVGVYEATSRLHSGQRVRVDGSAGIVTVIV